MRAKDLVFIVCWILGWAVMPKCNSTYKPRFRLAVNNAVQMALCIECSPAVQEVPGSIPDWDALVLDALCRGCRWLWSSLYIVLAPTWCNSYEVLRFSRHATEIRAPCSLSLAIQNSTRLIKYIRVWVKLSHNPQSRACDITACSGISRGSESQSRMALCIECSPAVQEVLGSIPDWDALVSDALWKVFSPV
jgi:hypothetical protein